jgi:hypothetical protein
MDKEGAQPTPRGFGFVTLLQDQSVEDLLREWPWVRSNSDSTGHNSATAQEALKFGFRTISKARWEELRDEYLAYREELLRQIAVEEDATLQIPPQLQPPIAERRDPTPPAPVSRPQTHALSSYPIGCLVLVRNIHPETNKTTLRTLFTSTVGLGQELLDYVDYNKGMNSVSLINLDQRFS